MYLDDNGLISLPPQRLPASKRTKKWLKHVLEWPTAREANNPQ